jgi:uncharacterized protein (DUF169 family)
MSDILRTNAEYAEKMRSILKLRSEPVALKLIKTGEEYPRGPKKPESQLSHCQAVFRARKGECFNIPLELNNCHVGAAVLGMCDTPEKVASGEFHASTGIHDSTESAMKMMDERITVPFKTIGETVCPLKNADFIPDVVIVIDIAERIYWITAMMTAEKGGRAVFSNAPFQCACEDVAAVPMVTGSTNISLGCFGCRKKTDMAADELACGIPYAAIPGYVTRLKRYADGPIAKAKRD